MKIIQNNFFTKFSKPRQFKKLKIIIKNAAFQNPETPVGGLKGQGFARAPKSLVIWYSSGNLASSKIEQSVKRY